MASTMTSRTGLRTGALVAAALSILAAGCSSSRFGSLDSRPAPLNPAPSGTVTSSQLPPPTPAGPTDPSAFPPAPGSEAGDPALASAPATPAGPPAGAADVTKEQLLGAWKVSAGGASCQMMLSLTKQGSDFRAASLRCPGDAANVAGWNVGGKQVTLKDSSGNTVARLYSSGPERYDGQTAGGQPISLSR